MGPKHGVARGTAVFSAGGSSDAHVPREVHVPSERLRAWSRDHGLILDDSPESLSLLDEHLDEWNDDATHHGNVDLSNEGGAYLGTVIVKHIEGARWRVWPNGHPIIRLKSGKSLDVTRMAADRLNHSGPTLHAIFSSAHST